MRPQLTQPHEIASQPSGPLLQQEAVLNKLIAECTACRMPGCRCRYIKIDCEPGATLELRTWQLPFILVLRTRIPGDAMDESSPLHSDEPQSLSALPPRISAENMQLPSNPHDGSVSPLSTLASTAYSNRDSGERGEAAPAYTPIDRQLQPHLGVRHADDESHFRSDNCVRRLWLWEILSIAAAALALVAIVITLVLHRDRPLPKWPSAITINALIAVFTAVFKACLMMPIAEGIGQLKWLWYQKSRSLRHMEQWDLASRGRLSCLLFYRPPTLYIHSCFRENSAHMRIFRPMGFHAPDLCAEKPGPCSHWCYPHNSRNGS